MRTALVTILVAVAASAGVALAAAPAARAEDPAPTSASVQAAGRYTASRSTVAVPGTGGGDLYLPTDAGAGCAGVVVMPGYSDSRASVAWLAAHLASHGYVVLLVDPVRRLDWPVERSKAIDSALDWLVAAPAAAGVLDPSRLAVWGYSMGGGGALRSSVSHPALVAAVEVFPWAVVKDFSADAVPSLIFGGEKDLVAAPGLNALPFYSSMRQPREYVELAGAEHTVPTHFDAHIAGLSTAWLGLQADDDERYRTIVCTEPTGAGYSAWRSTICG